MLCIAINYKANSIIHYITVHYHISMPYIQLYVLPILQFSVISTMQFSMFSTCHFLMFWSLLYIFSL